jgi:hypothetical protein
VDLAEDEVAAPIVVEIHETYRLRGVVESESNGVGRVDGVSREREERQLAAFRDEGDGVRRRAHAHGPDRERRDVFTCGDPRGRAYATFGGE